MTSLGVTKRVGIWAGVLVCVFGVCGCFLDKGEVTTSADGKDPFYFYRFTNKNLTKEKIEHTFTLLRQYNYHNGLEYKQARLVIRTHAVLKYCMNFCEYGNYSEKISMVTSYNRSSDLFNFGLVELTVANVTRAVEIIEKMYAEKYDIMNSTSSKKCVKSIKEKWDSSVNIYESAFLSDIDVSDFIESINDTFPDKLNLVKLSHNDNFEYKHSTSELYAYYQSLPSGIHLFTYNFSSKPAKRNHSENFLLPASEPPDGFVSNYYTNAINIMNWKPKEFERVQFSEWTRDYYSKLSDDEINGLSIVNDAIQYRTNVNPFRHAQ